MSNNYKNNFIDSPTRRHETILVRESRHAVTTSGTNDIITSNIGKDMIQDINFTTNVTFYFMDHMLECDHCARHMNIAINQKEAKN